jgi:predicted dehydrogenase
LDDPSVLGIVLNYPNQGKRKLTTSKVRLTDKSPNSPVTSTPCVGFIGAGNYASRTLIPAFKEAGSILDTVVTSGGISGVHHGNKNKFLTASTNMNDVLNNESINTVAIVTRHNLHAPQVIDALNTGRHVFVEKPLALALDEIEQIDKAYQKINKSNKVKLMVGFNRRFAPHIIKMKELLSSHHSPKSIIMTVNAGAIPAEHWVQDILVGGGRIVGEGCHFIDLMRHLVGHSIVDFTATMMGNAPGVGVREDKASITLSFTDGSLGTILYLANGGSAFPKERIEVFCDDAVLQMDNYRMLTGYGWPGFNKMKLFKQDKGQRACVQAFVNSIREGKDAPIPYAEALESSRISIEVANTLRG